MKKENPFWLCPFLGKVLTFIALRTITEVNIDYETFIEDWKGESKGYLLTVAYK